MSRRAAPIDLGRLSPIGASSLKPGVVLWARFCVIEPPRETDRHLTVAVTDLERDPQRTLGDGPHLEMHRLPAPSPDERARWQRGLAVGVRSRVQARAHAFAYLEDGSAVVLSDPAVGTPLTEATPTGKLEGRKLLVFAFELAGLLAALQQAGAPGVRFAIERLRVSDGHYHVDGFSHLQPRDDGRDLEALLELIRSVGGQAAEALITPAPTSALDLRHRLRPQIGVGNVYDLPPEPPFVGRDTALELLSHGFAQAQIAKATIIVVRGPRGVGKSRLLREFVAQRVKANDSLVLTGAREGHSADTRGGLLGALDQLPRAMSRLDEDERDDIRMRINRAARGVGAIVARSAPSLGAVLRQVEVLPPLELGEDFTRHTAVIAELFRALGTSKRPLVVVLDNLESANSSALAVLKILAEASPAHHSLIVAGLRTDGTEQDTTGLEAESLALTPLGVDEVIELLTRVLPGTVENVDAIAESLCSSTNGMPLALWASLQTWLDRGHLTHSADDGVWRLRGSAEGRPEPGIRSLFGHRLAGASQHVREFSLHAAVLGMDIGDDEVRYLCDLLGASPDDTLADVVDLGLMIRTRGRLRFSHSSIREFVLESFDEIERRSAHNRAAKMLTERQAPVAQIAYHRDLGFDPEATDPAQADRLSRLHVEAGRERLSVYDLERARWHLERALEHSRDPDQRGIAAEGLADICLLLKDLDTAVSLYTAIIATSDGLPAVQIAGKVAQYLFFQSAFSEGRLLGAMALEQVGEPTPKSSLGQIALFIGSVLRSWFRPPKLDRAMRDALLRVHWLLAQMCFIDDPLAVLAHIARAHWLGQGLQTAPAAVALSLEAFMWGAAAGRYEYANKLFARAVEITTSPSGKDIYSEGYARHNWALNLFASNRYEDAQDMSDDAIGALREAGDVAATAITIMFKAHYGRDRESAERILRWCDEAISTSLRNGKTLCLISLQCLKLHIFARQGRGDLKAQLAEATTLIEQEDTAIERLIGRTHLAFAAFECSEWELGAIQVRKAIVEFAEGPGVPEFCQDFFLVAPLILMELPNPSREDRKLFRSTLRKFRGFAKRSPRLRHYKSLLDLKLAIKARNPGKIRSIAATIVAEYGIHENLYMSHHAHLALSQVLKGEAVLAAAEHERMARKYGRRLGLGDFVLSSLVDEQDELLELGLDSDTSLLESQSGLPAAGMLTTTIAKGVPTPRISSNRNDQSNRFRVWTLTGHSRAETTLGAVLDPVRAAASGSISEDRLDLTCADPNVTVPIGSSDLQVLIINMLLACQDTLDSTAKFSIALKDEQIEPSSSAGPIDRIEPGHYLSIRVSGHGAVLQNSLIGGFSTCENLANALGGRLSASTDKSSVTLMALIPIVERDAPEEQTAQLPATVIVHPDIEVREQLGALLEQLGAPWRAFEPHDFGPANINRAKVVLADGGSLDDLVVLGPLLDARLIEIVKENADPMFHDQERLRLPIVAAELGAVLRGS